MKFFRAALAVALITGGLQATTACAYPLDAGEATGIWRLEGQRLVNERKVEGSPVTKGARASIGEIDLRLTGRPELTIPPADEALARRLSALVADEADRYGLAVLDLSDPERPLYAGHNAAARFNPGSVGKVLVATGLFQLLADLHPVDTGARRSVLRDTTIEADEFIRSDSHEVPFWMPGDARVVRRPLREGDRANLWSYLDWMMSASSNAAASMVMKNAVLLARFGAEYPPDPEATRDFFSNTSKSGLSEILARVLDGPLARSGLDSNNLRQGGFFTSHGKSVVPGTSSHASSLELLRFLLHLEQGRIVDMFSSREIKRLLYMTDRRIRYASSPALYDAAVYYKSGSLYRCRPEPGFVCKKYHGNVENIMNSIAIVEMPGAQPPLHYLVAVTSNVLRRNSAVDHQTLATRIHRIIEERHRLPAAPPRPPEAPADSR